MENRENRVKEYTKLIAEKLNLHPDQAEKLKYMIDDILREENELVQVRVEDDLNILLIDVYNQVMGMIVE